MTIPFLVWSEIRHRKLNFALSLLAVVVAVACSVGLMTLIRAYHIQMAQRILAQQVRTAERVAALDDEIRKITKNMGFNITILPKAQNLADFHANDFAEKTMPMEFVERLANSPDVVTINHLRPALIQKTEWPERNRQILLMGVSGVVPLAHRDEKQPLAQPVPKGTMQVGSVLAAEMGLKKNEEVLFRGQTFRVGAIHPQRGSKDDITVWIDLEAAQGMLGLAGRINMIQALECNCASVDRLAEIQAEISGLLGNEVQVIELSTTAIARAKAREGVKAEGQATMARWEAEGQAMIGRLERLAALLLPLVIVGASTLVGLLSLLNVRERRAEIGILRALGTGTRKIMTLFVTKALILGALGSLVGYALGFFGAVRLDMPGEFGTPDELGAAAIFRPELLVGVLLVTPMLAAIASWLPAVAAAQQDPAVVLREE